MPLGPLLYTSRPFSAMRPVVASRIRLIASSSVLLPEPLGPSSAASSPPSTLKVAGFSACTASSPWPKVTETFSTSRTGTSAPERELRRRAQCVPDRHQAREHAAGEHHREG